jgi:Tfp pilus assembly protein PilW
MQLTLPKENQSGLTLVALVVSLVISVFLFATICLGIQQTRNSYQTSKNTLYQVRDARKSLLIIVIQLLRELPHGHPTAYKNDRFNFRPSWLSF